MTSTIEAIEKKVIDPAKLPQVVADVRALKETIVTLNGSFDLLHAGHLQIFFEAAGQGDVLIVGLNSDRSIQQYKSPDRPIIPLEYRLQMVAALSCVDYVTWFDEVDPREWLKKVQPDVHVNGVEYGTDCIESQVVKAAGGQIHLADLVPGLSTTNIIKKIRTLCDS